MFLGCYGKNLKGKRHLLMSYIHSGKRRWDAVFCLQQHRTERKGCLTGYYRLKVTFLCGDTNQ